MIDAAGERATAMTGEKDVREFKGHPIVSGSA